MSARVAAAIAIAILSFGGVLFALGDNLERFINRVEPRPLPLITDEAHLLHRRSLVVDLHADSLLFGRDLLERSNMGHVDLPRLRAGGVGVQIFTAATRLPLGMNIESTDAEGIDLLTLAGIAQISPIASMGPLDRALWQAKRLREFWKRSEGGLVLLRSRSELEALLALRGGDSDVVGALLGVEGAHVLEERPDAFEQLFDAGYRMIGFTHFFDNAYAGSAHGVEKGGLSQLGRDLVARMEERGVLIDLAHVSGMAMHEILAIARKPTVVSHTGVRGTCDNTRNLADHQIRAVARGGGVIGIGYWETAVCGTSPYNVVAAMRYVIDLVGDDHVALGSDYDGGTTVGFDTSALAVLTQEMLDHGLSEATIRKILGANAVRVLAATLP